MKITRLAFLALALPLGLGAQQPAGPPVNPIATVFPEPVCEVMRRSRPASAGSSTAFCTGVRLS